MFTRFLVNSHGIFLGFGWWNPFKFTFHSWHPHPTEPFHLEVSQGWLQDMPNDWDNAMLASNHEDGPGSNVTPARLVASDGDGFSCRDFFERTFRAPISKYFHVFRFNQVGKRGFSHNKISTNFSRLSSNISNPIPIPQFQMFMPWFRISISSCHLLMLSLCLNKSQKPKAQHSTWPFMLY